MTTDKYVERAQLLIEQNRAEQAEQVLRQGLAENPQDGYAHSLLAICMMRDRDRLVEATGEAELGIRSEPGQPFSYYAHSLVMERRNQIDQALTSIERAIELNPVAAAFHGARSGLLGQKEKWAESLEAAETGLQFDAEDEFCGARRSIALERLGRVSDALAEAERATRQNPDSSVAHANRGWALLNKGDHRQAQAAFREALRLDPGSEFARNGMVSSLNSNNFIFRNFYRLMMKLSRLDSRVQFALIIGMWIGIRFLNSLARNNDWLVPWVLPISLAYLAFVMMSWIAVPVFNAFLRFHPFGRYLLSTKEKWASNTILIAFAIGGVVALLCGIQGSWLAGFLAAVFSIYLTIPLSIPFNTHAKWATIVASLIAVVFSTMFIVMSAMLVVGVVFPILISAYQFGILIYCFASQYLLAARDRV